MLVEDDLFWRKMLISDLAKESDMVLAAVAGSKEEAVAAAETCEIDVVLMDINLTENRLDGLEAAKEIFATRRKSIKIIMLTSLDEREVIIQSFQSGAVNYITKSNYPDIVQAIRDAYANKSAIHFDAAQAVAQELQLTVLTPMEKELYLLKEKGMTKTEISEKLHKSINTIKTQLKSIRDKLRGSNKS
ncbi:MAG: LuxR family transcriptional regulator [Paenibacillus sp.]|jgi:DNA-binding NarL/FixJ family response regulator|nr:LuxR family transcriptional regulator [Paenibacillus sp.]